MKRMKSKEDELGSALQALLIYIRGRANYRISTRAYAGKQGTETVKRLPEVGHCETVIGERLSMLV